MARTILARIGIPLLATLVACAVPGADAAGQRGSRDARDTTVAPPAGQDCEWCGTREAPPTLTSEARIAGPDEPGTRLEISGIVYRPDGRTPARDVVLYVYHTNARGIYPRRGDETGNARRHGYLRGWLRTDAKGRYRIATIRPAPYPTRGEAAHIHVTAMTPGGPERWIDAFLFADDSLLTAAERARLARGDAPFILRPVADSTGVLRATSDIVLEWWP